MHNLRRLALWRAAPGRLQSGAQQVYRGDEHGRPGWSAEALRRAITHLQQALAFDPTNDRAHYNLGMVYKDQKKWSEAIASFENAAKYAPDNLELPGTN